MRSPILTPRHLELIYAERMGIRAQRVEGTGPDAVFTALVGQSSGAYTPIPTVHDAVIIARKHGHSPSPLPWVDHVPARSPRHHADVSRPAARGLPGVITFSNTPQAARHNAKMDVVENPIHMAGLPPSEAVIQGLRPNLQRLVRRAVARGHAVRLTEQQRAILHRLRDIEREVRQEGRLVGLPDGILAAIAYRESGFNPSAVAPAGDSGLFQINNSNLGNRPGQISDQARFDVRSSALWTVRRLELGVGRWPTHPLEGALTAFGAPANRTPRASDTGQAIAMAYLSRLFRSM